MDNSKKWKGFALINYSTYLSYCIIILATITVILFTFYRLYFGVDFTDEAFYVGISYRFAIGARPFIDEVNLAQTSSLIIVPFIKLYHCLVGSPEGIILFSRRLYFAYTLIISGIIFACLKRFINWQVALLIALTFVVLIPYGIPNLSYNTLGCGLFTVGCISGLGMILNPKQSVYFLLPGLFHGLAAFAYPTLLIPILFFMGSMFFFSSEKFKIIFYYGIGAVFAIALFLPIIIETWDNIIACFIHSRSHAMQLSPYKLIASLLTFWKLYPYKILLISSLILATFSIKRNYLILSCFLLLIPFFPLLPLLKGTVSASLIFVSYYAFLAPYLLFFVKEGKRVKQIFWILWIPSFIAGLTFAWSSSNGYLAAGLGFFQGSLVTAYYMYELFERMKITRTLKYSNLKKIILLIPSVIILLIFTCFQYTSVYRDNPIPELNTRVISGPYSGMFTSVEKNQYLTQLSGDLAEVSKPGLKVLFYDRFPAGYLFTSMIPATNACWLFPLNDNPSLDRQATIDYFIKYNMEPDIVVRMKMVFYSAQEINKLVYSPNDPLNNMVESKYEEILSTSNYSILRKLASTTKEYN